MVLVWFAYFEMPSPMGCQRLLNITNKYFTKRDFKIQCTGLHCPWERKKNIQKQRRIVASVA